MNAKAFVGYKTIKNFLSTDSFEEIKNTITNQDFPWRRRDHMAGENDKMYLQKLEAVAPIEVRANMSISELYEVSGWHRDYKLKCKSSILYLNSCDGGTELKINDETVFIKSEANKMLIFDADVLHRGITSKKEPIRYIINFNYFTQ